MTRRKSRPDLDAFHAHLDVLKLSFIREHYPDVVRCAAEEQSDHLTVLERLIGKGRWVDNVFVEGEANLRRDRSIERRIRLARFPVKKTLDSFDWSWPKNINRLQVQNLFRLRFLDDATNVVLVGGVGLGKSHLVTALGLQACERGYSVLFTSAIDAINTLAAAKAAGQLKRDLRRYLRPRLLILDELGYLPIDKTGADLLFQIISQRYERGSIAITTNRVFKHWPEIFNHDATLTSAVLDRLLHHAETVTVEGNSFRMKGRDRQLIRARSRVRPHTDIFKPTDLRQLHTGRSRDHLNRNNSDRKIHVSHLCFY